ncbi:MULTISPECIES: PAS domain-containing protein [unclassified Minwuia]|uniref:PAS domain-containing protein n=1 Tax=unclassified Minwuia TaxID=2618799 RepID=UPI0024791530|nr:MULTISPECIES: PAS domain-containing protein [unclassified Minwuia]
MLDRGHLRPQHLTLLDYWSGLEAGGRLPSRSAVNPLDLPRLLKNIGLIDEMQEVGGNYRYRYRLVGTQMNHITGMDLTNRWLTEVKSGELVALLESLYAECVVGRTPVFSRTTMQYSDDRELETDRLLLPLATDGTNVDMLLFSNLFRSSSMTFGLKPFHSDDVVWLEESLRLAA